jgi:hypothetical protein
MGQCFGKKKTGNTTGGSNDNVGNNAGSNKYQQAPDPETARENARAAAERRMQEQNLRGVQGNKPKLPQSPMSPGQGKNQTELSDARAWN